MVQRFTIFVTSGKWYKRKKAPAPVSLDQVRGKYKIVIISNWCVCVTINLKI